MVKPSTIKDAFTEKGAPKISNFLMKLQKRKRRITK